VTLLRRYWSWALAEFGVPGTFFLMFLLIVVLIVVGWWIATTVFPPEMCAKTSAGFGPTQWEPCH
jgi:hypothetical protein